MSRTRFALILPLIVGMLVVTTGGLPSVTAAGSAILEPHVPGEILLKFRPGTRGIERANVQVQLNAQHLLTFREGGEHWRLGPGQTVEQAIGALSRNPNIEHVTPNYLLFADLIPNDPNLPQLYGMINTGQTGGTTDADIDADQAWSIATGSRSVVVGVIDTGVNHLHPDLAANIWTNAGEIPGNNLDDDGNGFIDDVHGYDFVNNDGDPMDDHGHGSHVSGTIGGVGDNGLGVVGVNWQVSIMGLKFLSASGSGSTANAVRAVNYATMMGVDLTSNSWGGGGSSPDLLAAIAAAGAAEIPFIAAAGNNGTNNDVTPHYPSNYDVPNVISVAATDHNDLVASFSNYGAVTVDLAAPGVNILSTVLGTGYNLFSGTSMATPHVAGAAALLKSRFPNIPAAQLKFALMNFVDLKTQLSPTGPPALPPGVPWRPVASGGRLNVFFSIADPDNVPPGSINDLETPEPGSNHMVLAWTATGDDGDSGTSTSYQLRYSTAPIDETNFDAATRATGPPNPGPPGTQETMEVGGLTANTTYYFVVRALDEWGNAGTLSNVAVASTLPPPTAGLAPASIADALFTGGQSDHVVTLRNDGVGTLDFSIPVPSVSSPLMVYPALPLDKGEPDPRPGILGSGGPDAAGYRWVDSDDAAGPPFNWVDISTVGTPITTLDGDDEIANDIPIGFPFPFYENVFSTVNVSTNGWLSFTNRTASGAITYTNQPLPNSSGPENMLALFWDDLHFRAAVHAYYHNDGSRFIVQWNDVDRFSTTELPSPAHLTFQVILYADGDFVFQYLTTNAKLDSSTVGIQNAAKNDGLTVVFNGNYLHDNLAVTFDRVPQWLTAAPLSGRIPAGGSLPIGVHLDATGLEGGTYPGSVRILTNDPVNPELTVSVSLQVTGAPDAVVAPAAIDFGDIFLDVPFQRTLTVANAGTDTLHVSSVVSSSPELSASPTAFDLAPRFVQDVTLVLTGGALGPFAGSVTVHSDDMSEPAISIPVTGNVLPAPIVVVNPASLQDTLFSGNSSTQILTVSNTGGSDLVVTASADQGNGGTGITTTDPAAEGQGGPDAFGYRWRDSDASGGPGFNFVDISSTGTLISFSSQDNALSPIINMGMTFPLYGTGFQSLKISTNGWLTFDTTTTATASSNGALPSTSLGRSAIAMFWDDLHLRTGNVRYLNDGLRFIIQYTNVGRLSPSTGQSYTFQAQLYPNGRILLMYQTMVGTLNSATIGVQNQARTIALQVVSQTGTGTPYVHDNLALEIKRTPDWLSVTPAGVTIPPGGNQDFDVVFDATDRVGGALNGNIVLNTNIPNQATLLIPATLNVIGAPNVVTAPTSFDFGIGYLGYPLVTSFQVFNDGTEVLNVSEIDTTDPTLTVEDQPGPSAGFQLPPGIARLMNLRWSPTSVGPLNATVRIHSDDPDTPIALIQISGTGLEPPIAVASPTSFTESLNVGDVVHRNLRLENQGNSDLNFSTTVRLLTGASVTVHSELELDKEQEDPRPGILGLGGPDLFGYVWRDSDDPAGPVFDWTDISATGTPVAGLDGDDENIGPIPIGFPFGFYGNTFTQVRVGTNGFLTFTSTLTAVTNQALPNSGSTVPDNLLAAFWDDLEFRGTVRAHYLNDGTRFIVQYTDVDRVGTAGNSHLTFQVILYPNGRIVYQYLTMSSPLLTSATIGIQNALKNDGLTVVFNAAYVHDGLAVEFSPPFVFPSVTPSSGTIPAGGQMDLDVRIDASGLNGGDYAASLDVTSNDPAQGLIPIPVNLHVTGVADIVVQPANLSFPDTFVGGSSSLTLLVRNVGNDVLNIPAITASGDFAHGATLPMTVGVSESRTITVTFSPTQAGQHSGSLTFVSNDPDGDVAVPLEGVGLMPPVAVWSPGSFTESLNAGDLVTRNLHLENQGANDLVYGVALRVAGGAAQPIQDELILDKDEIDPRPGILGNGGPDQFGYTWRDSDAPGGPVFYWTDISGIGTPVAGLDGDDENLGPIPIGFPFSFYGNTFTDVRVGTNGFLTFTSTLTAVTNQALPNSGSTVPNNLLAAFWDDLEFRGTVRAHYLNDGTRFIVQYTDVDRVGTAGNSHLTFQVILHPDGRIVYQYLTMSSPTLTSHTIGIQNALKNDGLTVVFNSAYVHNDMAIEIRPPVDFLSVAPESGIVPPGASVDLAVQIDTVNLVGGDYAAIIELITNDPLRMVIPVPVSVHITDAADIDVQPGALVFPDTFVGFSSSLPVTVHNRGSLLLTLSSIQTTGAFSVIAAPPYDLPDDATVELTVSFNPPAGGPLTGSLTIDSNDPDEPSVTVALSGNGVIPPEIGVTPAAISTALPPGGSRTKTLTIDNSGGSDLVWTGDISEVAPLGVPVTVHTELELGREEIDPRPGILGSGGPDLFGYKWEDSDEPGGPVFNWVDISGVGTPIMFDPDGYCVDCTSGPFPIGFNFPFYGNTFNTVRITTEGWISFTSDRTTFSNQPLPNSGTTVPENVIAAFWDDLVLRNGTGSEPVASHGYYHYDGTRFIVQWDNFYVIADFDTNFTFQTILYPNGKIVHQYLTMVNGRLNSATIGQQNATKNDGFTVVHNMPYMHDGLAIQIQSAPDWVTMSPESGTIPAGGSQQIQVLLNAAGLDDGTYDAEIRFSSNDPYTPVVPVPVSLSVGLMPFAYLHFDPEVLNLAAGGNMVKMVMELPAGYDPHLVDVASVTLNDTVQALPAPVEFTDENLNGIEEIVVRFDRDAVDAVLPDGATVQVTVQGEITDVQWFRGTTTVRTLRPRVIQPNGGEYVVDGQAVPISWNAVQGASYKVLLTRDGGQTWEILADNLAETSWSWMAGGSPTTSARIRVVAFDNMGVVGYDTSDGVFTLVSQSMPPGEVGDTLELMTFGGDIVLTWRRPVVDALHGPAEYYRVLAAESAQGPFIEVGTTQAEEYRIPAAGGPSIVYYRILAANAAGNSAD